MAGHGKNKEINPDFFFNLLRIRFKKSVEKLCNKTKTTQKKIDYEPAAALLEKIKMK